ncbi:hypothetical protein DPV78_000068 [Talaromyces pinophilus]|nr:hypothetical protein DPV78_000068 [Talaromyces pinophilus]
MALFHQPVDGVCELLKLLQGCSEMASRPRSRDDFTVAIVCALRREYDAITLHIDQFWDENGDMYGKVSGDPNMYRTGRIGRSAVVLVLLSGMGKVNAAAAARSLRLSYQNLRLVLLTGICGGVPSIVKEDEEEEVLLGDVVISDDIIQYDFGRRYDDGFEMKDSTQESLGKQTKGIQNFVAVLKTHDMRKQLEARAAVLLSHFQKRAVEKGLGTLYQYPGSANDKLYLPRYRHMHHLYSQHPCNDCCESPLSVCKESRKMTCRKLGCSGQQLVARERLRKRSQLENEGRSHDAQVPSIFVGRVASGDTEACFIGRSDVLARISRMMENGQRRIALWGIGGVGKTEIATNFSYHYKASHNTSHVFWVYARNRVMFMQSYYAIARLLGLLQAEEAPTTDTIKSVSEWLSNTQNGPWLMVIDSADSAELFSQSSSRSHSEDDQEHLLTLAQSLPSRSNGLVLLTTNNKQVALRFSGSRCMIQVETLALKDSIHLLKEKLAEETEWDDKVAEELVRNLDCLPLAITQAAAYMNEKGKNMEHYSSLVQHELHSKRALAQDYYDDRRYRETPNGIFLTWQISFKEIMDHNWRAMEILSHIAFLEEQSVPIALIRQADDDPVSFDSAIGEIKAYSFLKEEKGGEKFTMHRLVRLCTQVWTDSHNQTLKWQMSALNAVFRAVPEEIDFAFWTKWEVLLPHIELVVKYETHEQLQLLQQASIMTLVARYHRRRRRFELSRIEAERSFSILKRIFGMDHCSTLEAGETLAMAQKACGHYEVAESLCRDVLRRREAILGTLHPHTLRALDNLSRILASQKKFQESLDLCWTAFQRTEKSLGPDETATLSTLCSLGNTMYKQREYEKAEKFFRRCFEGRKDVLGLEHPETLAVMGNLGSALMDLEQYDEAERILSEAAKLKTNTLGTEHPSTLSTRSSLGTIFACQGRYVEAEELLRQVFETCAAFHGNGHVETKRRLGDLEAVLNLSKHVK